MQQQLPISTSSTGFILIYTNFKYLQEQYCTRTQSHVSLTFKRVLWVRIGANRTVPARTSRCPATSSNLTGSPDLLRVINLLTSCAHHCSQIEQLMSAILITQSAKCNSRRRASIVASRTDTSERW